MRPDCVYPDELLRAERSLVTGRRDAALEDKSSTRDVVKRGQWWPRNTLGLALSGGGIRSATFCLGFLQSLARRKLLRRIDFLSTVSGGGYIGGCVGRMFTRAATTPAGKPVDDVETQLADGHSPVLERLRNNGRYLSPNGGGDVLFAGALILRNFVAVNVLLVTAWLAVSLAATLARILVARHWDSLPLALKPEVGWLWWSPYILLPLAVFAALAFPLGWAYWLTQRGFWPARFTAAAFILSLAWVSFTVAEKTSYKWPLLYFASAGVVACACLLMAWIWARMHGKEKKEAKARTDIVRNVLSQGLKMALVGTGALLAFALVDSLAQTVYAVVADRGLVEILSKPMVIPGVAALIALVGAAKKLVLVIGKLLPGERVKLRWEVLASSLAVLLLGVYLTIVSAAAQGFVWSWSKPAGDPGAAWLALHASSSAPQGAQTAAPPARETILADLQKLPLTGAGIALAFAVGLSLLFGRILDFLNLSSQHTFYAARLIRAYLGASNPKREGVSLSRAIPGDDIARADYHPEAHGGPLHLVNTTINETRGGSSSIEQRDRKGLALALGPLALSVGRQDHAFFRQGAGARRLAWLRPAAVYERLRRPTDVVPVAPIAGCTPAGECSVEELSLGHWLAVSGAAFTTGLGSRTSFGTSLMLGLSNVRLGYWWWSELHRANDRPASAFKAWFQASWLTVQRYFLDELLARFPGTQSPYWYLSDGGHFENTACYELIRRRVPLIVCCDCGADPGYAMTDMADLARRVRVDFGAEIELLDRAALGQLGIDGNGIGAIEDLIPAKDDQAPGANRAHAVLAQVTYPPTGDHSGGLGSLILFVKPSLAGGEPIDISNYAGAHQSFPQEGTADQFFDEAQWESYRKLGEHIGGRVLTAAGGGLDKLADWLDELKAQGARRPGGATGGQKRAQAARSRRAGRKPRGRTR
jgi:hypothetical protein